MSPIYLDYNATTPIDPQVAEAMLPYLHQHFGNPSSSHDYGQTTAAAVDQARGQLAGMLGCHAEEVIFTSGGTESNNHAIKGVAGAYRQKGNHIITSSVEHPAVLEVCRWLETQGFRVSYLPVDGFGAVDPQRVEAALTPETVLVSIMHANNEVGTIQPIAEIAAIAHRHGALMHTDAAQSVGKIPVNVADLDIDLLSIAGHKLYAPKGIGALYIRKGVRLEKLMHGAGHEMGWRNGERAAHGWSGPGLSDDPRKPAGVWQPPGTDERPVGKGLEPAHSRPLDQRTPGKPSAQYLQRQFREPGGQHHTGSIGRAGRLGGSRLPRRPSGGFQRAGSHGPSLELRYGNPSLLSGTIYHPGGNRTSRQGDHPGGFWPKGGPGRHVISRERGDLESLGFV